MQRVLAGSEEAAQELFDNYAHILLDAIRRRLSSRMRSKFDSQDFAQDVWASFFAASPDKRVFASPHALVAFLTHLAQNKVIDAVRQRGQAQKSDVDREQSIDSQRFDQEQLVADQATASQLLMNEEEWGEFHRRLREHPPVYRRVFNLLRAGKTQLEIAEKLGVTPRTVRRIMWRLARETIS